MEDIVDVIMKGSFLKPIICRLPLCTIRHVFTVTDTLQPRCSGHPAMPQKHGTLCICRTYNPTHASFPDQIPHSFSSRRALHSLHAGDDGISSFPIRSISSICCSYGLAASRFPELTKGPAYYFKHAGNRSICSYTDLSDATSTTAATAFCSSECC